MKTRVVSPSYTRVYVPKAMSVPFDPPPFAPGRVVSIEGMGRTSRGSHPHVSTSPSPSTTFPAPPIGHVGAHHVGHRGHGVGSPPAASESVETLSLASAPMAPPGFMPSQVPFAVTQGPLSLTDLPWQLYLGGAIVLGCIGYTAWALFFRSST